MVNVFLAGGQKNSLTVFSWLNSGTPLKSPEKRKQ
jgi:hypothetical protein